MQQYNLLSVNSETEKDIERFSEALSIFKPLRQHFYGLSRLKCHSTEEEGLLRDIASLENHLTNPDKCISFFGVFKAGKSSLLNAILGEKILPSRTNRATGVVTKISYGSQKLAQVIYNNDNKSIKRSFPWEDLAEYILLDISQANAQAPEGVECVNLQIPHPLLAHHCHFVDTPGLLDNPTLTARTYEQIEKSDLCVIVLAADKLLAEQELKAIEKVNNLLNGGVVFLLNRIGVIEPEEKDEIIEWAKSCISGVGNRFVGQGKIFPTDAAEALSYKTDYAQSPPEDVVGLLAFESWFKLLFSTPSGDRLAMLSRLGILNNYLNKALSHFKIQLWETQGKIKDLEDLAAEDLKRRQYLFNESIEAIKLKFLHLKTELREVGEDSYAKFFAEAKFFIQTDESLWLDKVKNIWQKIGNDYLGKIEAKLKVALAEVSIAIPHLAYTPEANQILDINIESDMATKIGKTFGSSFVLGSSRWLGKNLLGVDLQRQNLDNTQEISRKSLLRLYIYLEKHFTNLDNLLEKYIKANQPVLKITPELVASRKTLIDYDQAIKELTSFKKIIKGVKSDVMSWEIQFNEQWEGFEKKIKSEWNKYSFPTNKEVDLRIIANKLVSEELKTWHNDHHYNGSWLNNLKREEPEIANDFEKQIKQVAITQSLAVPKKVKPPELLILGISGVVATVVLLWGQNLSSIKWNKFNLKQGAIAAGLLYSGGYSFQKIRTSRLYRDYDSLKEQIINELEQHQRRLNKIIIKADEKKP